MKKWSVGELQALRAASRFLIGIGVLVIIVCGFLSVLFLQLSPEDKHSDIHKNDPISGGIAIVIAAGAVGAGWKLGSFVKKCEAQTGQSSKPFGGMS
jgi:hypothetical protein